MSWNDDESALASAQPVWLFDFVRGETLYYRYTDADRAITVNDATYTPLAISLDNLTVGSGDNLDVTLPADNIIARLFRGVPPSQPVRVRIYRAHVDDQGMAVSWRAIWLGRISDVKREATDRVKLITASVASDFTRNGLRLTFGRGCQNALYDHHCRVNPEAYAVTGIVIDALDGATITVTLPAGIEEGWFSGGFMAWPSDGVTERRGLKLHEGNQIGVFGGTQGLSAGMAITLYPGCDRTIAVCDAKFANHLNYGGQPHMPGMSPFGIIKLF